MLFQIYGETAGFQLLGWLLVFVGFPVWQSGSEALSLSPDCPPYPPTVRYVRYYSTFVRICQGT